MNQNTDIKKKLVVYKKMRHHLIKDMETLKRTYEQTKSSNLLNKINKKEQSLHDVNKKIEDIKRRLETFKPIQNTESIEIKEEENDTFSIKSDETNSFGILSREIENIEKEEEKEYPMEKQIEIMNEVDRKQREKEEKKKEIEANLEILRLKREKETQMQTLRKHDDIKKELEKQKLKKEIMHNKRSMDQNEKIFKRADFTIEKDENDDLKEEIEKKIYIELKKKELELQKYQDTLKSEEDSKITNVISQVRQENRLQLDKYEQLFKKRDEKIRTVINHLNDLGGQLNNLTRTKNPNTLKFVVHKTLNDHKQCINILNSLIVGEENRIRF